MSKKIFIMMFLIVLSIAFTLIGSNRESNRATADANVVDLNSLAYAGDYNDFSMSEVTGGAGGGLGLLIVIGIDYIINNIPDKPIYIPTETSNDSFEYVSDVLSNHTLTNLNNSTLTEEQISSLIFTMTGLRVDELNDDNKKSLYLGTLDDQYNQIAEDNSGVAFYNESYTDLISHFGEDNMWLINSIIIEIAIYNQWNIYLVSNPNLYYDQVTKTILSDRGYAKELWLINVIHNKYWYYSGRYWKVSL